MLYCGLARKGDNTVSKGESGGVRNLEQHIGATAGQFRMLLKGIVVAGQMLDRTGWNWVSCSRAAAGDKVQSGMGNRAAEGLSRQHGQAENGHERSRATKFCGSRATA